MFESLLANTHAFIQTVLGFTGFRLQLEMVLGHFTHFVLELQDALLSWKELIIYDITHLFVELIPCQLLFCNVCKFEHLLDYLQSGNAFILYLLHNLHKTIDLCDFFLI